MTTNKKPAPGWNRGTGYGTAFDSRDHNPIHHRLQALLTAIAGYDAPMLAMLALIVTGVLP